MDVEFNSRQTWAGEVAVTAADLCFANGVQRPGTCSTGCAICHERFHLHGCSENCLPPHYWLNSCRARFEGCWRLHAWKLQLAQCDGQKIVQAVYEMTKPTKPSLSNVSNVVMTDKTSAMSSQDVTNNATVMCNKWWRNSELYVFCLRRQEPTKKTISLAPSSRGASGNRIVSMAV